MMWFPYGGWPTLQIFQIEAVPPSRFSKRRYDQSPSQTMTKNLENLLEAAKNVVLTPEEKERQRRSFAYGNTTIENPRVTREMVDRAADELGPAQSKSARIRD